LEIVKVCSIIPLAQDFMKRPVIMKMNGAEMLVFDYESDTGEYKLTGITFKDVITSRHTRQSQLELYMLEAYNAVAIVKDSVWLSSFKETLEGKDFNHYLIYFDGYGAYEFIAKDFTVEINDIKLLNGKE
jgi:hypothetical protein